METTFLDHEKFDAAKILADIGTKIAAGRAELSALELSKEDFFQGREAEALGRVSKVLEQSKELVDEIEKYHDGLVGFRNQLSNYADDVRSLVESVQRLKKEFDTQFSEKNAQLDEKIAQNAALLGDIRREQALLDGENSIIAEKRRLAREDKLKADDALDSLTRAQKEINQK